MEIENVCCLQCRLSLWNSLLLQLHSRDRTRCAKVKWEFGEVKRTDNKDHSYLVGDPSWDL